MSNTAIQLKKSGVTGNTPGSLAHGEVALNYADGKLFYKNDLDSISYITNQDSFSTVSANGNLLLAVSPTDILTLTPNNGIYINSDDVSKTIYVGVDEGQLTVYNKANNALPNTGSVITVNSSSILYVSNTQESTGNTTGALVIEGGLGLKGDIYTGGGVYALGTSTFGNNAPSYELTNPTIIARNASNTSQAGQYYVQVALENQSASGSGDYIVYVDTYPGKDDDHGWIDIGITGSVFADPAYGITKSEDGYIFSGAVSGSGAGGNLVFATDSTGSVGDLVWATGGFAEENEVMRFSNIAKSMIIKTGTVSTSNTTGSLVVSGGAGISGNLYTGAIAITGSSNGLTFADGTTQYSSFVPYITQIASAGQYANSAFQQANAAFEAANTAGINYTSSNTAPVSPNLGDQWYYGDEETLYEYATDGNTSFWWDTTSGSVITESTTIADVVARIQANGAYTQANTNANEIVTLNQYVSDATTLAQNAYNFANTVNTYSYSAYAFSNTVNTFAYSVDTKAQAAFDKANTAITTSGGTSTGTITSNNATAFIAGPAANSGVALQMPREGAIRDMTNGASTMYFDASNGGTTHGYFNFRSSSNFTSLLHLGITKAEFNPGMEVKSQTPYIGRTSFNSALDTVVTVDNIKYRISNQGGIFPQIASASGSTVDVCYDVLGVVNGAGTTNAQNSGYILLADGTWLSIYSSHGMDARGDRLTAHITDKNVGKIYRATFMRTNNSSNVDGYNIIVERIL